MSLVNTGTHIADILRRTKCKKHNALENQPCWDVYYGYASGTAPALCGARIKRAGYVGKISAMALQRTPGGRGSRPSRGRQTASA